jgi:enterochelin esterase-like enzyme
MRAVFWLLFVSPLCISAQVPITERPLVYQVPGMGKVQVKKNVIYKTVSDTSLSLDIYYPPGFNNRSQLPVVIFNNGVGSLDLLNWRAYTDSTASSQSIIKAVRAGP